MTPPARLARAAWLLGATLLMASGPARAERDPFRNQAQLNARLRALVKEQPKRARLVRVAVTAEHREVLAVEVDPDGDFREKKPVLLIYGGVHGLEWLSIEVVLHLLEYTTSSKDPLLRGLIYHFVPCVNADGFEKGGRLANGRGKPFDVNRDFPVPFQPDRRSEPLVEAFRQYAKRGRLAGALDYHTPAESIMWPWAFSPDVEPEGVEPLKEVVEDMARASGYWYGQTARVIDYRHQGTAQDWIAWAFRVPAVLVELGFTDGPGSDSPWQELIDQERPFRIFVRWIKARAATPP